MEDRDPFMAMLDAAPVPAEASAAYQPPAEFLQAERGKKLEMLTDMALARMHEILSRDGAVGKALDQQIQTIRLAVNSQLRADEAKLQDKVRDTLGELVKMMNAEEAKRAINHSLDALAKPAPELRPPLA